MYRYKNIFFCIADPIKNLGSFKDYLIENTEYLVAYHFFLGYTNTPSYYEIYEFGKKTQSRSFNVYTGKNNFIKNI